MSQVYAAPRAGKIPIRGELFSRKKGTGCPSFDVVRHALDEGPATRRMSGSIRRSKHVTAERGEGGRGRYSRWLRGGAWVGAIECPPAVGKRRVAGIGLRNA
ncbi:hypothetical protein NX868_25990 [Burkholderia thailandensis]|uniref:hypothetical protein n=1 Tax=Burkholderia thailandensis TaxID=57975 RepID=UPI001D0245B6|nr:hypothetical protein [Burkholderia thailandensis]MCS3394672.1 hypothetical protein [Burkholderia thailandensis]MCS6429049.1 hypothetical protein [Burkholderia thailandensis]MCS6456122.1 hypothetical protein [Burkholderia thailandensis]MCS6467147.1 hypothetical protein [Burkholderia thailandensis]MCS6485713.1 hypothetical protein [Burkholderia thailandensis]